MNDRKIANGRISVPKSDESESGLMALKTLQELRMLSSVTLDCQVTRIVVNSGAQLSEL